MKFLSKLVKTVSAFVASAVLCMSGSAAMADFTGVGIWDHKAAPTGDPPKYKIKEKSKNHFTVLVGGKGIPYKVCGCFKYDETQGAWIYTDTKTGTARASVVKISDSRYEQTDLCGHYKKTMTAHMEKRADGVWYIFDKTLHETRPVHWLVYTNREDVLIGKNCNYRGDGTDIRDEISGTFIKYHISDDIFYMIILLSQRFLC